MRTPTALLAFLFMLVSFSPAQANGQCSDLSKAAYEGDSGRTAALIASGVSVNCSYTGKYVKDNGKTVTYVSTSLNTVAWGGRHESVRLLLSHGANVNLKDGNGHTPLYNADDYLLYLDTMGRTKEEWEEAEEIYRLLKRAGGVL